MCGVWSGQADLFDLLLRPEEGAAVVTSASMGGTGSEVGDHPQDAAAGGGVEMSSVETMVSA